MSKQIEKPQSYLERLVFDSKLFGSIVAKYISNVRIVLLLAMTIILLGVIGYLDLPRRLNPEVKIPIVSVVTALPGASSADVESLVTIPIENQLRSVKGLDVMTSTSRENVSIISMQFLNSVDRDKAKDDVQSNVDSVTSLPEDAQTPKVSALDFEGQPVWTFVVTSKSDLSALMSFSKTLAQKLEDLPKIDKVTTGGFEEQEVVIKVDENKMVEYGINPLTLSSSIKKSIDAYPAGNMSSDNNTFALTIDPTITSIADIRNLKVTLQNKVVNLSEIAEVSQKSKINQKRSYLAEKNEPTQRAVTFYVYKTTDANIDEAGQSADSVVNGLLNEYSDQFKVTTLSNTSEEIDTQFNDLLGEFKSTIILVFTCLLLFLGLRQAVISSVTVPLTFLSAFIFMSLTGMSINFLSLFAFLLALGLLVDDTIVVVSAMTTYYKTGKFSPLETGLLVWRDTIIPIWSTTITTIWSFVPLLITSGIIGEFIKPIPVVVTAVMMSSTAIAVLITLPIMVVLLKPAIPTRVARTFQLLCLALSFITLYLLTKNNPFSILIQGMWALSLYLFFRYFGQIKQKIFTLNENSLVSRITKLVIKIGDKGVINVEGLSQKYYRLIARILDSKSSQNKVLIAIVIYAVFSFSLLPLGFVTNEFFPKSDQTEFYVSLELPMGTTLENTEAKALPLLAKLNEIPEANFVTLEMGKTPSSYMASQEGENLALFTVHLPDKELRKTSSMDIAQKLRNDLADFNQGNISIVEASSGPPAGSDLQIKFMGDDLGKLDNYASQIVDYLQSQPEVTNIEKSVKTGTSKIVFVPDSQKLAESGLTIDSLGIWTRIYTSGFTLDSVNFDKTDQKKTDVVFKIGDSVLQPSEVGEITIPTNTGKMIPLTSMGTLSSKPNPTVITREDGKRTLSVSASVKNGYSLTTTNKKMEAFAATMKFEPGYSWKTGGVNDENKKSIESILKAMILSAVLILITMVIQFQSFRQSLIVLIVIPLAVSSVFLAFALTGTPLSFPAMIGVMSLFGIVVTNSMFIVDKININQRQGMPFKEAIADAGASRLEPIILTKLCTVLGLLPITLSNALWRGLGGAIISGILVASTIMLLFIPVLYYRTFRSTYEK